PALVPRRVLFRYVAGQTRTLRYGSLILDVPAIFVVAVPTNYPCAREKNVAQIEGRPCGCMQGHCGCARPTAGAVARWRQRLSLWPLRAEPLYSACKELAPGFRPRRQIAMARCC